MKTPADWERVRELFNQALALPLDERALLIGRRPTVDVSLVEA